MKKTCSKCGMEYPATNEFFYKRKNVKDGLSYWCKNCSNKRVKKWNKENPNKRKNYNLQRKFSITKEEYDKMLQEQNGVCAICGCEETDTYKGKIRDLAVDHDHKTGEVRGLLCFNCNKALGKVQDNPFILIKSIKYLKNEL